MQRNSEQLDHIQSCYECREHFVSGLRSRPCADYPYELEINVDIFSQISEFASQQAGPDHGLYLILLEKKVRNYLGRQDVAMSEIKIVEEVEG